MSSSRQPTSDCRASSTDVKGAGERGSGKYSPSVTLPHARTLLPPLPHCFLFGPSRSRTDPAPYLSRVRCCGDTHTHARTSPEGVLPRVRNSQTTSPSPFLFWREGNDTQIKYRLSSGRHPLSKGGERGTSTREIRREVSRSKREVHEFLPSRTGSTDYYRLIIL